MSSLLGDSFGQKCLTLLSTALAIYAWMLHQKTGDPTPLLLTLTLLVGGVLDTGVTVRGAIIKQDRRGMTGAARVAYYFVLIFEVAVRQAT